MTLLSPCKINLLLNILGKRPDGFHELETVMQPVALHDELEFAPTRVGVELTCDHPSLPVDGTNLVHRAATRFLERAGIAQGVRIHLSKRLPLAAGLGGGSANAAVTLRGMNALFGGVLDPGTLHILAASLGSDVPFFLQDGPALATGRGERIQPLEPFPALRGTQLLLVHPGFGISTPWAYGQLALYPEVLNGRRGRAEELVRLLQEPDLRRVGDLLYNSLETPALTKYPILAMFQDFFRDQGALATLMSGSGSTTFAILPGDLDGAALVEAFGARFGREAWTAVVPLG